MLIDFSVLNQNHLEVNPQKDVNLSSRRAKYACGKTIFWKLGCSERCWSKMSDFHVKNTAFSRKDARERAICTKLGHPILFMILNYCFHKMWRNFCVVKSAHDIRLNWNWNETRKNCLLIHFHFCSVFVKCIFLGSSYCSNFKVIILWMWFYMHQKGNLWYFFELVRWKIEEFLEKLFMRDTLVEILYL